MTTAKGNGAWGRVLSRVAAALVAVGALAAAPGDAEAKHPAFGQGEPIAAYSGPTFPEGIVVDDDRIYVAGPANFEQTNPEVRVYHRVTGALLEVIPIKEATPGAVDGLSCITTDSHGRLYVVSEAQGILRLSRHHGQWQQEVYAPLPADGLPGCVHFADMPSCHLLNDLAFDGEGFLYVTDSLQETIYRVAPGGGELTTWFQDERLLGAGPFPIGVNGIRVSPDNQSIYFTVSIAATLGAQGVIYALPRVDAPEAEDLTEVYTYDALGGPQAPDGIAFGESGELYVALAFSSQVSIVDPDAHAEVARLSGPLGSPIPYDAPANIAFDRKGSILVTNHASLSGNAADFGVLRVFVGDRGAPLEQPCE